MSSAVEERPWKKDTGSRAACLVTYFRNTAGKKEPEFPEAMQAVMNELNDKKISYVTGLSLQGIPPALDMDVTALNEHDRKYRRKATFYCTVTVTDKGKFYKHYPLIASILEANKGQESSKER